MAPEYGATCGIFPVDEETLIYLRLTGRSEAQIKRVEAYARNRGFSTRANTPEPIYTDTLELDLGKVEPSLAGPSRPQDRVALKDVKKSFLDALPNLKVKKKDAKPAKIELALEGAGGPGPRRARCLRKMARS